MKSNRKSSQFSSDKVLSQEAKNHIELGVSSIIKSVKEFVDEDGTLNSPIRVSKMYEELLSGYLIEPDELLNNALFDVEYDEMVIVKGMDFYSLCEHHMLPFYGKAHVGYTPQKKIVGLSKIPRIIEMYARRLQVQERMTQQIASFLFEHVDPIGVGVVIEAQHLCAAMRGIKKPNTIMITSTLLGHFKSNSATREEFMSHVR